MAIIGPQDLPVILKVDSNPIKKYILSKLGYPITFVEFTEDQFESIFKMTGDFIAQYFPLEEKFAFFQSQPLVTTYDLPADAAMVREVAWDPATTKIDEIFGAESFLFCMDSSFKILDKDMALQPVGDWKDHWKAKTPYGNRKLQIVERQLNKQIPKIEVEYEGGKIIATINHPIKANDRWRQLDELVIGDQLSGVKNKMGIKNLSEFDGSEAISIRALRAGAYYGCHEGEPVLVH